MNGRVHCLNVTDIMHSHLVPVTTLGVLLMDRSGRKPLLLVSTSGLLVRTLMSAVSFYLKVHGIFPEQAPIVALTSILVHLKSLFVWLKQIFPINMKGIGGSFVTLVNWLTSLAVSFAFNFLVSWSSSGTFFFFAFDCAMAILFIVKIVPETKGKALEEIQGSINWDT
ncbi:sugar transporter ERD6-like 16 [Hordeum vulgare]|nr:sugar transporter ERD6-like 16 [Hordeum vulgare]